METGGRHVDRVADLEGGVRTILREAGTYYSLGTTLRAPPPRRPEGYSIELLSTRPGVAIQVRRHLVPRNGGDAAKEAVEAVALFGAAASGLPVELRLGEASRRPGLPPRREVVFEVRIPIASLELEEKAGAHDADVELTFLCVDTTGDTSDPVTFEAHLRVPDGEWESAREATWPWGGKLVVRSGSQRVTVTVRDLRSDRIGTAEAEGRFD